MKKQGESRGMRITRRYQIYSYLFFFSSRRRHTRLQGDWSSDVCSSDLVHFHEFALAATATVRRHSHHVERRRANEFFSGTFLLRSEERRVGKECRSRRWRRQSEKKNVVELEGVESENRSSPHDIKLSNL